ncbi:MAG: hypothetical protein IPM42_00375 [Saprospiraceae bacterium]|nr:hypothetical protein [Saprospiraceae bacterium]
MNNIKFNASLLFVAALFYSIHINCQTSSTAVKDVKTAQPTIMAIPFAKEGQSLRQMYENNELVRIAITKVKEAFDKRGVNTIDLRAKLKQNNNNAALQENQASDMKDEVIALSGADIYIEVEASPNYSASGNSANVIMTAFDAFSGESLANKVANSPKVYTDNFEKLIEKAVDSELDNLLNTIQEKFNDILINGRTITLNIGVEDGSSISMDDEVDSSGDLLSELIENWVENNAFKSQYHLQGVTANRIKFDLLKVPMFDESGKNFRVSKFASELRKFLKTKGVDGKSVIQGNNLVFTISPSN